MDIGQWICYILENLTFNLDFEKMANIFGCIKLDVVLQFYIYLRNLVQN
jgi:hypothetical protein